MKNQSNIYGSNSYDAFFWLTVICSFNLYSLINLVLIFMILFGVQSPSLKDIKNVSWWSKQKYLMTQIEEKYQNDEM